jgi:hypothetical protein
MSSNEYERSSSSPVSDNENRREPERERSRSRDKHRHRPERDECNYLLDIRQRQRYTEKTENCKNSITFI